MNDYWLNELKKDSENYKSPTWDNMSERARIKTMNSTLELFRRIAMSNKIHMQFDGEVLEFDALSRKESRVKLKLDKTMDADINGVFDSKTNKISINRMMVCSNDGVRVFENLLHEFAHKLDWELSKRQQDYSVDSKHYTCLNVLRHNLKLGEHISAFGVDCGNRLYTDGSKMTSTIGLNTKKEMLYRLITTERHANSMAQKLCQYLFEDYKPLKYIEAFHYFRCEYHCQHFSNDQIAAILDRAQECIINGRAPRNSYDAVVAYDIATTVALNNGMINAEKYTAMQIKSAREKAIAEIGFEMPWSVNSMQNHNINKTQDLVCDLEYLQRIPSTQQLENPELIFQVARVEMDRTLDVVKDLDALKDWYYSKDNTVPISVQGDMGVYLGIEFSPRIRQLKMNERGEKVREEERKDIGIWPHEKEILQEMDFSNVTKDEREKDEEIGFSFNGLD